MKLLLPIAMLFVGAPLLAQPQVLIDNRLTMTWTPLVSAD